MEDYVTFLEEYPEMWILVVPLIISTFMVLWGGVYFTKDVYVAIQNDRTCSKSWHRFHDYEYKRETKTVMDAFSFKSWYDVECRHCHDKQNWCSSEPRYDAAAVSAITGI